jgi:hypothetical protein
VEWKALGLGVVGGAVFVGDFGGSVDFCGAPIESFS